MCLLYQKGLRDTRENEEEYRTIFVNNVRPDGYNGDVPLKYGDNEIVTSKVYTYSIIISKFIKLLLYW